MSQYPSFCDKNIFIFVFLEVDTNFQLSCTLLQYSTVQYGAVLYSTVTMSLTFVS